MTENGVEKFHSTHYVQIGFYTGATHLIFCFPDCQYERGRQKPISEAVLQDNYKIFRLLRLHYTFFQINQ